MKVNSPATSQNCEPVIMLPGSIEAPCKNHTKPKNAIIAPTIEKIRRLIPSRAAILEFDSRSLDRKFGLQVKS